MIRLVSPDTSSDASRLLDAQISKIVDDVLSLSTYVLNITPRDETELVQDITNTRVWVDCENWMLLGMEMYDPDGNLAVKSEYRDITFNTGIPDSEFIFEVPEDAAVVGESFEDRTPQEMTLEDARDNLSFDLKTPLYLPDGCEFDPAVDPIEPEIM